MSAWTDIRDSAENVASVATAPFTAGQSERLVSKSGQASSFGHVAQMFNNVSLGVDIAALVAGGAYLAAPEIAGAAGASSGAGGTTALAADAAVPAGADSMAPALIQGGDAAGAATAVAPAAATPASAVAPAVTAPVADATAAAPAVDSSMGMTLTPGPGGAGPMDPAAPGMVSSAMNAVESHPITSLIGANMLGGALTGMAKRKADLEELAAQHGYAVDLATLPQRQKQGNPSVGGGGVNLNIKPGNKVLTRPDGTPVYRPGTGIINTNMNGARG